MPLCIPTYEFAENERREFVAIINQPGQKTQGLNNREFLRSRGADDRCRERIHMGVMRITISVRNIPNEQIVFGLGDKAHHEKRTGFS
ncbi:MAG TPA: hypothetical protein VFG20_15630 [Planctomycetaceae bacterium]|nr:hypothetical protein [Planctomycetaceae bacterium]